MVTQGYTGAHKGTQGHTGAHKGRHDLVVSCCLQLLISRLLICSAGVSGSLAGFMIGTSLQLESKCNTSWCHWVCSLLLNELRVSMVHVLLLEVLQLPLCLLLLCCILLKRLSMRFKYRQLRLV